MTRKVTEDKTTGKEFDVLCAKCKLETCHKVLKSINDYWCSDDHPEYYVDGATEYQIIECQGCKTISFRSNGWFSEDDFHDGYEGNTILYPQRSKNTLPIKEFYNVPKNLRRIYREVIDSYNNELTTLCSAGLRAIIEGICSEKKIKHGLVTITDGSGATKEVKKSNLQGKISGLAEKGILTKNNAEILHEHRFLGNEALHELVQPSMAELKLAIEIVEHVLESIFEIVSKAKELRERKVKRKK